MVVLLLREECVFVDVGSDRPANARSSGNARHRKTTLASSFMLRFVPKQTSLVLMM